MNDEMKRRVFLASIIGTLIGVPVSVRLLTGKRRVSREHSFSKQLTKYRPVANIPISPLTASGPFSLPLKPPIGEEWKYVFFSPTFLPDELSQATNDEPDFFFAREGVLYIDQMSRGPVVLTGGDTLSRVVAPMGVEEKEIKAVSLLVKEQRLVPAKVQGQASPANVDLQLLYLLTPNLPAKQELSVGMKWKSDIGRIKPFVGLKTDCQIAGFAEIQERKCVDILFSGSIPNLLNLSGVNRQNQDKDAVSSVRFGGHGFFDLESGFLVRQEVRMESFNSGVKGYRGRDGSGSLTIKTDAVVQIDKS